MKYKLIITNHKLKSKHKK